MHLVLLAVVLVGILQVLVDSLRALVDTVREADIDLGVDTVHRDILVEGLLGNLLPEEGLLGTLLLAVGLPGNLLPEDTVLVVLLEGTSASLGEEHTPDQVLEDNSYCHKFTTLVQSISYEDCKSI